MQRSNKYRAGRKFNKPRFDKNTPKKYKDDILPEQLSEIDVGITEYVSEIKGFSGVLKARFADFQVNEIDLDGQIAKFTTTIEPEGFDSDSLNKDVVIPKETPSEDIPQDIWTEILAIIDSDEEKIVELDSTGFDKEKRGNVHRTVKSILQKKIIASTIQKDDKKYITFKKYSKDDKFEQQIRWPEDKGEYVYFLVYKENIDTLEAALRISSCLRLKPSLFNYAGVKDRRAKTTQWFSVRKVQPWKLLKKTKCLRNIHIGNITFKNKPLKLGKLQGNRFRIALRNISAEDEIINKAMNSLKEKGFINYYGLQRFGNDKEVPTHEIGIKLLLGKFKEACNLILKCKSSENPYTDVWKAKKIYSETGKVDEAIKLLKGKENDCVESKLLYGLAKSGINNYVNALENLPRNMRLLYIHAFQGLIWNKIVSRRIKEFGLSPIVGDIVFLEEEEDVNSDGNNEIDMEELNETEDESIKNNMKQCEKDDGTEKSKSKNVKILTQEDLENYSIYDIVLPLPGYDISYPENITKEWYKNILEEYGLTLEMPKQSVKTYTLSGGYRHIVKQVTNLSWKVIHYKDPSGDLIRSDFEEFLKRPEPVDQLDGQYKALIIDFCLSSSCYATMVVREILKTDTSSSAHSKLNDYHSKKEPVKVTTEPESTLDSPAPNSLLSDPVKYEDFKKLIYETTASENSLKRKAESEDVECATPEKKTREEDSNLKLEAALV